MIFHHVFFEHVAMWILVLFFSFWGGVVRYLIKSKRKSKPRSYRDFLSQITVSIFVGVLGGLYSVSRAHDFYMVILISAVLGSLGGSILPAIWVVVIKLIETKINTKN